MGVLIAVPQTGHANFFAMLIPVVLRIFSSFPPSRRIGDRPEELKMRHAFRQVAFDVEDVSLFAAVAETLWAVLIGTILFARVWSLISSLPQTGHCLDCSTILGAKCSLTQGQELCVPMVARRRQTDATGHSGRY
jgi:hypothetical protein